MFCTRVFSRGLSVVVAVLSLAIGWSDLATAGTVPIKVMTYNTNNGGDPDGQLDTIAAQNPDVVVLQEASYTQLAYYVDGMNSRLHTTVWHGQAARHCKYGTKPTCTTWYNGSVMILTRLTTLAVDTTLIWAADDYQIARASMHMRVALEDGTPVHVFVCHLPAMVGGSFSAAQPSREVYVSAFQQWAAEFSGPQLVGGDFNTHPDTTPFVQMTQVYADAWSTGGSGPGYTHSNPDVTTRLDYWWSRRTSTETLTSVTVVPDATHSDHRPVVATYDIPSTSSTTPSGPTTLLTDTFTTFDRAAWPNGVFTGTEDATIALAVANGAFTIGPLVSSATGAHYDGISTGQFNLTRDGYATVQLVRTPNLSTAAYAMFAAGSDGSNFYRWTESAGAFVAEKKIGGVKTALFDMPYDAAADQFLRIQRAYNSATGTEDVVFETAPNVNGVPGTFTVRFRENWNASVDAAALRFELKAGTSGPAVSPGVATWDNFSIVAW